MTLIFLAGVEAVERDGELGLLGRLFGRGRPGRRAGRHDDAAAGRLDLVLFLE